MTTTEPAPTNGTAPPADRPAKARPTERPSIHAYCTPLAHHQWHAIGVANGFSASALIEAMAPYLALQADGELWHQSIGLAAAIKAARRIDFDRRRRIR